MSAARQCVNTASVNSSVFGVSAQGSSGLQLERVEWPGTDTRSVQLAHTEGFYCLRYLGCIFPLKTLLYIDAFRIKSRGDGVLQNTEITGELP